MKFNEALTIVLRHEGGYSNHAADPGGATNFGITERTARAHGYSGDMRDLPLSMVQEVYRKSYWERCRCDDLPDGCRLDVFDAAVNSGVTRASIWLQEVVGAAPDGKIGALTVEAASKRDGKDIGRKLTAKRLRFMTQLSTWQTFGKGWARRIADNLEYGA